ncbi:uncharacterized protein [Mytilus edulis]|uniref:uncharacterized protein n=1 Tax=Mytilus edulis TaxID=6550 RepID=UPI0039EE2556
MSWMMYIEPSETDSRSTILKYQNQNGTVPFHLELLSNGTLSCTMRDTNGNQYNATSRIKVTERKFIGVNFNFLWDKQFDFFHVYTDGDGKQIIDQESLTLNIVQFKLFLEDTTHVLIGSGFHGNISCIQFYNSSVIKSPLKGAPLLCDPVLTIDDSFGDYTIDVTVSSQTEALSTQVHSSTLTPEANYPKSQVLEAFTTQVHSSTLTPEANFPESQTTPSQTEALSTHVHSSTLTPETINPDAQTTPSQTEALTTQVHSSTLTPEAIYPESQTTHSQTEALTTQVHSSTLTPEANYPESQTSPLVTEVFTTQVHSSTLTPKAYYPEAQTTPSQTESLSTQVHSSTVTPEGKFPEAYTTPLLSKAVSTQIHTSSVTLEDKFSDAQTTPLITTLSSTVDNNVINERCVYFRRIANDTTIINHVRLQTATNLNDCAQLCWETTSCFQFSIGQEMTFTNCYIGDNTVITATLFGSCLYTLL